MERYTRVFSLPTNLYTEGSPIILEAGALLKDNANNSVLAQLKFKNVHSKTIKMLKVEILSRDSMGRALEPSTVYQYLDLSVKRDESFGAKQAIPLTDSTVRSFDVKVLEIGLEDNSIVKGSEADWGVLPNPTELENSELSKQCRIVFGDDFKYEAAEFSDLWYCACGALNRKNEETCHRCSRPFKHLSDPDIQELTAAMEQRLAEEKHQQELAEQKRKEEEAEAAVRKKKINKIIALAGATIAAVIAVSLLVTKVVIPNQRYNAAAALMDAGKYEEAIQAFEAMDGYKDSAEQNAACQAAIIELQYNDALALMNSGEYQAAIASFEKNKEYLDSEAQIEICQTAIKDQQYSSALELMNSGKYEEAIAAFSELSDYKDSVWKMTVCKLNCAKVGDYVCFGTYEQDNISGNGQEEIEWLVLDIQNGKALLLSRCGLDVQPFNTKDEAVTWENSTIRSWLNETFLHTAFCEEEQGIITTTNVDNSRSQSYDRVPADGGNNTQDKIFLLSYKEASEYLDVSYENKVNRNAQAPLTAYAISQGAHYSERDERFKTADGTLAGFWSLRSPVHDSVIYVFYDGVCAGFSVDISGSCVRPALWVDLNP